jgi:putative thioredoxin
MQTPAATSDHVIEATDQDFEAKVLERSREVPVLVDFWAPWCGPCKVLGPTLEKLAAQSEGRFELVKVNVDNNPLLGQVFKIRSIPLVKLFINGEIRDEFMGAYPESEIRRFLEHHLPDAAAQATGNGAVEGLRLLQAGQTEAARAQFEAALKEDPKNPLALIGMGYYNLELGQLGEAREFAGNVNEAELERQGKQQEMGRLLTGLRSRIFLVENAELNGSEPDDLSAQLRKACQEALDGDFEPALEDFLAIVRKDRQFRDDAGRLGMLAVFDLLPPDSPLLSKYRFKLSSLLFS